VHSISAATIVTPSGIEGPGTIVIDDGVMVAVEGTVDGDTVHVSKISEVKVAAE